jgi:hypothetical protein
VLNNPFDVPRNTLITFLNLGAVRQSVAVYQKRDHNGIDRPDPFLGLVYFWDADGHELGYFDRPGGIGTTSTKGRMWDDSFIDRQQFHPMQLPDTEGQP